ncbi:MAG: hypothetical protein A4E67_01121 [Syntrophaceae bacterium PtaB.Bin038]|nr:MAG: hypothetical protein A4E67_01121 [Syntrophaceae bacterium PtaB.Bin038]
MLPASKIPTTVQSRMPKRSVSPIPVPANRFATLLPARISADPGRGSRPSASRTWGRIARDWSLMPRMMTLEGLSVPRLARLMSTTTSLARTRLPPSPTATSGWVSMTEA